MGSPRASLDNGPKGNPGHNTQGKLSCDEELQWKCLLNTKTDPEGDVAILFLAHYSSKFYVPLG